MFREDVPFGYRIGALKAVLNHTDANGRERASRMNMPVARADLPSLRATVIKLLEQVASSSASDVSRHLEQTGFRVGGSTTLRERVAHERSRLRRKGVVRRARNGQYVIAPSDVRGVDNASASLSEDVVTLN